MVKPHNLWVFVDFYILIYNIDKRGFIMTPCIPVDYTKKIKRTYKNRRVRIDMQRYYIKGQLSAADMLKLEIAQQSKTL